MPLKSSHPMNILSSFSRATGEKAISSTSKHSSNETPRAAKRADGNGSAFSSQSCSQRFMHISAMTDGHEADRARFAIGGVDYPKASDPIFP